MEDRLLLTYNLQMTLLLKQKRHKIFDVVSHRLDTTYTKMEIGTEKTTVMANYSNVSRRKIKIQGHKLDVLELSNL